jgi:hypothetical protein
MYLLFVILCNALVLCAAQNPGDPYDCTNGRPANVETLARLSLTDQTESQGKYRGLDVFLETRDTVTKRYTWFGTVTFYPINVPQVSSYAESNVKINYFVSRGYFADDHAIASPRLPIRVFSRSRFEDDPDERAGAAPKDNYKYFLERSILEFTLPNILEVSDIYRLIEGMKIKHEGWFSSSTALPRYSLTGYAHRAKVWNCAVFSAKFLQTLGVDLRSTSDVLRDFMEFEYGYLKGITGIGAVVGGVVGCAVGFVGGFGIGAGPGAAGGVAIGATLFGGGKAVHSVVYEKAYPWVILEEIIKNHARLNVRPRFVTSVNPHVANRLDALFSKRYSLIENSPDKYMEWYGFFFGASAPLGGYVVHYRI